MTRAAVALSMPETTSQFLCPLADADDPQEVGGKAFNLARLIALGVPVPEGEVLTRTAFDLLLAEMPGLESGPSGLRLPTVIEPTLVAIAERWLGSGSAAVRSSAIGEDGEQSSFAGQFDSVLGVSSLPALRDAVRTCYASHWSARARFYRRTRGLGPGGMALVIQRQVLPTAAGVLFTRNPAAGAHDTLAIEYGAGLADRLVSGQIDPGRIVVSRTTGEIVSECVADGAALASARDVVANRLGELVRLALFIEEKFGTAQDIEWAIDDRGSVWIVQSRPITAAGTLTSLPGHANVLWTNANVSENFPRPISPFLYSIASLGYYHYFRNLGLAFGVSRRRLDAMDRPLRAIIGVHGARMYYNLTNIHAVLQMAPFGDRLTAAFNTFVGASDITQAPAGSVSWGDQRARVSQWLELARIAAATTGQYLFLGRRIRAFEANANTFAARTRPEGLAGASLATLGALLAEFIDIRCRRWKNASLADAAAMVTYALLEQVLARGGCDHATHTRLLRALPNVPSSMPPRQLWALSRLIREEPALKSLFEEAESSTILATLENDPRFDAFRRAFNQFLETWGFRSSAELMLTVPGLDERPEPAIDLLKQYAQDAGESPEVTIARQAAERRRETARVLRTLVRRSPLRAATAWLLIRWTQQSVAYRERARFKQALLYTRCRRLLLRIGDELVRTRQLSSRDDVFMLTCSELDELIAGRAMFPRGVTELVALRHRQHALQSQLAPPDTFRLRPGEAFSEVVEGPAFGPCAVGDEVTTVMPGTTACGGRVVSRASVLGDVSEAARLTRGDILVTRQTDPGWGPVFCLISGLIIERGGMLSHGAIIAREFGLPCIVGVKDATRRIPHGAAITLDADRGHCVLGAGS